MTTEINEAFIGRVYKTSVFIWAFGLLICLSYLGWRAGLEWTLGSALSMGVLRSLEWFVRRTFVPGAEELAIRSFGKFMAVKLVAFAAILSAAALLCGKSFTAMAAFCAGVVLTQAVIFLKVLGILLVQRLEQ